MSLGFKQSFNISSGFSELSIGMPGQDQPVAQSSAKKSMMETIAPKTNFAVNTTSFQQHRVDGNKAGAGNLVQPNRAAVSTVKQDIKTQMGAMEGAIKEAQGQVAAAAKAEGVNAGALYQDKRMGNVASVAIDLGAHAAGVNGAGSVVTAMQQNSTASLGSDEKFESREQAEAALEDRLRASSNPVSGWDGGMPGETQSAALGGGMDWNEFFDQGHELTELMALEPSNMAHNLPEYAALSAQMDEADIVLAELDSVEKNSPIANAEELQGRVEIASGSLQWMPGGLDVNIPNVPNARDIVPAQNDNASLAAALNIEPDPRMLQQSFGMSA